MKGPAEAAAGAGAAVPVVWHFLGYEFEAGPLVVAVSATLMTRLIVSLKTEEGKRRWPLDISVTCLTVLVSALWVQSNQLALLPAGISGISFGAMGIGIIKLSETQAGVALRAAFQAFLKGMGSAPPPPAPPEPDKDQDVLDRIK